jgi:hypothetical protein
MANNKLEVNLKNNEEELYALFYNFIDPFLL